MHPNSRRGLAHNISVEHAGFFNPMPTALPAELLKLVDLDDPDIEYIASSIAFLRAAGLDVTDPDIFQLAITGGRKRADEAENDLSLPSAQRAERDRARREANERHLERMELRSVVYYMRIGNRVKIGYTTNLRNRLNAINPEELVATEQGGPQLEAKRHQQFAQLRVHGEWFRFDGALAEHVKTLPRKRRDAVFH